MPTTDERTIALCREVADRLRAVAMDQGEDLTPAERRALIEIAVEMERRRGRGPQPIRVERVVVQDGGQAVVAGSVVTSGTPSVTSPPPQQAITQGAPPFVTGDALPVVAGDRGERE